MKSKLNLNQLKVESFVTELDSKNIETAKGGAWTDRTPCLATNIEEFCDWTEVPFCCPNTAPH